MTEILGLESLKSSWRQAHERYRISAADSVSGDNIGSRFVGIFRKRTVYICKKPSVKNGLIRHTQWR